jgi:hypothetical protein
VAVEVVFTEILPVQENLVNLVVVVAVLALENLHQHPVEQEILHQHHHHKEIMVAIVILILHMVEAVVVVLEALDLMHLHLRQDLVEMEQHLLSLDHQ